MATTRRSFFLQAGLGLAAAAAAPARAAAPEGPAGKPGKKGVPFRLGVAGYTFCHFNLDQTLQMMKRVDAHYLCIKNFHLPLNSGPEQIAAFHEKCRSFGVTGYGVGPIYMSSEKEAENAFAYARRVGVKTLVGVPFEMREYNGKRRRCASRRLLETIGKLCKQYDIRYAIHNHGPDMPELFPTAEAGIEMIKDLDGRIGLCLDIGHQFRYGRDPVKAVYAFKDRLFDLHLKNVTDNTRKGVATPLPRGKIDLAALVEALCAVRYTGVCGLEYERDMRDPVVGIAECIGYFRGLMDAAGRGLGKG